MEFPKIPTVQFLGLKNKLSEGKIVKKALWLVDGSIVNGKIVSGTKVFAENAQSALAQYNAL